MRILQTIAIFQSFPKLAHYIKIFDMYVKVVQLLKKTFVESLPFLSVFGFFMMFMTLLYINVGVEAPTEDDEDSVLIMSGVEHILR